MAGPDFTIYSWLSQRVDASNRPTSHYAEPCYSTVARPQKMYGRGIINNLNLKPDFTTGAFVRGVYSVYLPGRPVLELGLQY